MANQAPISQQSHDFLRDYAISIWNRQAQLQWYNKLSRIDLIFYCAKQEISESERIKAMLEQYGLTKADLVEAPLVQSQLETAKSILVDTFLTGYPLFGVVSSPDRRPQLEQLEALIAYYSSERGWTAALTRFFGNALKFTQTAIGLTSCYGYEIETGFSTSSQKKLMPFTLPDINVPDPYNLLFDYRVSPLTLATEGDYIGYSEMLPATMLKAEILAMREHSDLMQARLFNLDKIFDTLPAYSYYRQRPQVNLDMPMGTSSRWDAWGYNDPARLYLSAANVVEAKYGGFNTKSILRTKLWLRILPGEYGLRGYPSNTPMVFEVWLANFEYVYYIAPVYLPENRFPLTMVDLQNDGFDYSALTETESLAGFQYASSVLLNATLMGAQRSVDDRALYDSEYLSSANLTGKGGAAKIPLNKSLRGTTSLDQIFRQIPYEHEATASFPSLMQQIMQLANYLHGRNEMAQGIPRKGNRTLGEFQTIMANSDLRTALVPNALESQAFEPLKKLLKIWIRDNAQPRSALNHRTKTIVQIDEQTIREVAFAFKLATGYFNKTQMSSSEDIQGMFNLLTQLPELAQQFNMPEMLAYIMALRGVKDIDQFRTQVPSQSSQPTQQPAQAQTNAAPTSTQTPVPAPAQQVPPVPPTA